MNLSIVEMIYVVSSKNLIKEYAFYFSLHNEIAYSCKSKEIKNLYRNSFPNSSTKSFNRDTKFN